VGGFGLSFGTREKELQPGGKHASASAPERKSHHGVEKVVLSAREIAAIFLSEGRKRDGAFFIASLTREKKTGSWL